MLATALALQLTTVLVFTTTDCPIANRYAPEIRRLAEKFSGVRFVMVYPVRTDTPELIEEHRKKFAHTIEFMRDEKHELVKKTGVTVTPEVAVMKDGRLLYRGRIDDRYIDFGRDRPEPTVRDLERSLDAVLSGKPVPVAQTQAIGCVLSDLLK
ncbi:MAG TPA: thioredoxin-like domain-containing protein [Vicinamibacterales bacterium]|nr:thioredoxin-like domain-containing protein [Vicinamibacterales bacterium]